MLASLNRERTSTTAASEHDEVPNPGHYRREHAVAKQLALELRIEPPAQAHQPCLELREERAPCPPCRRLVSLRRLDLTRDGASHTRDRPPRGATALHVVACLERKERLQRRPSYLLGLDPPHGVPNRGRTLCKASQIEVAPSPASTLRRWIRSAPRRRPHPRRRWIHAARTAWGQLEEEGLPGGASTGGSATRCATVRARNTGGSAPPAPLETKRRRRAHREEQRRQWEEQRRPKVTQTITCPWPSQAQRERPNQSFLASHRNPLIWACWSLASRLTSQSNKLRLHSTSLDRPLCRQPNTLYIRPISVN